MVPNNAVWLIQGIWAVAVVLCHCQREPSVPLATRTKSGDRDGSSRSGLLR